MSSRVEKVVSSTSFVSTHRSLETLITAGRGADLVPAPVPSISSSSSSSPSDSSDEELSSSSEEMVAFDFPFPLSTTAAGGADFLEEDTFLAEDWGASILEDESESEPEEDAIVERGEERKKGREEGSWR